MHHDPDAIRIAFLADSAHYLELAGVFNAWQARTFADEQRASWPMPSSCNDLATPRSPAVHQTVMWPS